MSFRDHFTNLPTSDADLFRQRPRIPLVERRRQAAHAIRLAREGLPLSVALKQAGLSPCMTRALRECVAGGGPLVDFVKSGRSRSEWPDNVPTTSMSLIRWAFKVTGINNVEDPDNQRLRKRLRRDVGRGPGKVWTYTDLSRACGFSTATLRRFAQGDVPRLRPETRARIWAALLNTKQES